MCTVLSTVELLLLKLVRGCKFWMQLPARKQNHLDQRDERHASGHARSIPMEDHLTAHSGTHIAASVLQSQHDTQYGSSGQYELYLDLLGSLRILKAA